MSRASGIVDRAGGALLLPMGLVAVLLWALSTLEPVDVPRELHAGAPPHNPATDIQWGINSEGFWASTTGRPGVVQVSVDGSTVPVFCYYIGSSHVAGAGWVNLRVPPSTPLVLDYASDCFAKPSARLGRTVTAGESG